MRTTFLNKNHSLVFRFRVLTYSDAGKTFVEEVREPVYTLTPVPNYLYTKVAFVSKLENRRCQQDVSPSTRP